MTRIICREGYTFDLDEVVAIGPVSKNWIPFSVSSKERYKYIYEFSYELTMRNGASLSLTHTIKEYNDEGLSTAEGVTKALNEARWCHDELVAMWQNK